MLPTDTPDRRAARESAASRATWVFPVTPSLAVPVLPVLPVLLDKRVMLDVPVLQVRRETWASRATSAASAHPAGQAPRATRVQSVCLEFPARMAHVVLPESEDIPESVDTTESTAKLDCLVRRERMVRRECPVPMERPVFRPLRI